MRLTCDLQKRLVQAGFEAIVGPEVERPREAREAISELARVVEALSRAGYVDRVTFGPAPPVDDDARV